MSQIQLERNGRRRTECVVILCSICLFPYTQYSLNKVFFVIRPRERDETERVIRCTLKEIMMSVDLDEVTSKAIRGRLEDDLDMDLAEFKSFIDQEMLTILGQMDAPTEIFEHVYLGSEWNASNLEELQRNGYERNDFLLSIFLARD